MSASELMRPETTTAVVVCTDERDVQEIYLTTVGEAGLLYGAAILLIGKMSAI